MVIVRAGATVEEIAATVAAVGIPSKETSHVASGILTTIVVVVVVVTTPECFVKCTGRNVKTQLIPT